MQIRSLQTSTSFPLKGGALFTGCWEYELHPGEVAFAHSHAAGEEINLILEGRGVVSVGDVTREVGRGEVVFIPSQTQHSIRNPSSPILRGISVEASSPIAAQAPGTEARVTIRDLEEVIASIPNSLSAPEALQRIIKLFDLAGYLSEQIENALGLDSETSVETLARMEALVMGAVVTISRSYEFGSDSTSTHRRRF
ncbi:MAG: cupin domain-containing protein [Planctomycetes bacterium]|nr:cupin domain-containing protein [Planctomycetota bacterium]